jgi:hypothetical protein
MEFNMINKSFESNSIETNPCNPSHISKKLKNTHEQQLDKNKKPLAMPKRVKKSPSYLLFIMKSMSKKRRPDALRTIVNSQEKAKLQCLGTDTTTTPDQSSRENFSNECVNSIKTNHFAKLANPPKSGPSQKNAHLSTSKVDEKIKQKIIKQNLSSNLSTQTKATESLNSTRRSSEINTEALEFLFNLAKNILFLAILLLLVWPISIVLKIVWLVYKYMSALFPNLERTTERVDEWHRKANQLEEKLIDKLSFLN